MIIGSTDSASVVVQCTNFRLKQKCCLFLKANSRRTSQDCYSLAESSSIKRIIWIFSREKKNFASRCLSNSVYWTVFQLRNCSQWIPTLFAFFKWPGTTSRSAGKQLWVFSFSPPDSDDMRGHFESSSFEKQNENSTKILDQNSDFISEFCWSRSVQRSPQEHHQKTTSKNRSY